MFCRLSILPVINKVPGASPMTEYVKGIFHSSGGAFLKLIVKGSCVSETLPPSPRLTFTMGNPGCSVQPVAISAIGWPDDPESPFQESGGVGFDYSCAAIYLRSPSRKHFSQQKFPAIRETNGPFC